MVITIYDSKGNKRADFAPNDSSTQAKEIQGDNVLTLSFTHYEYVILDVNDYADFCGERYWLTERYRPKQVNEGEWQYDIKLYGVESLIKRFLVLETTNGNAEPVFTLTAPPREHVAMIVKCINQGMGTTDWKVGQVDGTDMIVVDYDGTYCDEGLKLIAAKAGGKAEWWIDGQTVNVCRCEHGEELTLGYGQGLTGLECDTGSINKFYTRLFPVGSSRNIDPDKYGYNRLMLPGGKKFVELHTDEYGIYDHYERDAFSGIYPRYTGTVSSVRSEEQTDNGTKFTVYYFKDTDIPFDPNKYELAGQNKYISFQTGELAGLGQTEDHYFEANYNSETKEWELITIWPYDDNVQLPGGALVPKAGDKYIPWNISMPDEYLTLAEKELSDSVDIYNEENWQDASVYKAPTDHVWVEQNNADLFIGRRVKLLSKKYFPAAGYRSSRITKVTRKVSLPTQTDLEISDARQTGTLEKINDNISSVKDYVKTAAGNWPDIVRSWEDTPASDFNVASFKMMLKQCLSRLKPDDAHGLLRMLEGAEFGRFVKSMSAGKGAGVDALGNMQVESLESRTYLKVMEIIFNRLNAQEGDTAFTDNGSIESLIKEDDGSYSLYLHKRWDNDFTSFQDGDVVKGIVNNLSSASGEYYTAWFRVLSVDRPANKLSVVMYPDNEVPAGKNFPPAELMRITRWGNAKENSDGTYNERQSSWYISSSEGRMVFLMHVTKPIIDDKNYALTLGLPPNLQALQGRPVNMQQPYLYARGIIYQDAIQIDYQGHVVKQERFRGTWSLETAESDNPYTTTETTVDVVYWNGCKWQCLVSGTLQEPRYASTDWQVIEYNDTFKIDLENTDDWRLYYSDIERPGFKTTITVTASVFNEDITDKILDSDITWTRDTGNVTEDNAWAVKRKDDGKTLVLQKDDFGVDFRNQKQCSFTCTALLRDGENTKTASINVKF